MAKQFAVGVSKEVLLVHFVTNESNDVNRMFLVHVDDFQPGLQRVVLVDQETSAKLISYFFNEEERSGKVHVLTKTRHPLTNTKVAPIAL